MSNFTTVEKQIRKLIQESNEKTERMDDDLTSAVGALIDGYGVGSGLDAVLAEDVAFSSEQSEDTTYYAMDYNWFAEVVRHVQDMCGSNRNMKPEDILYWLGRVKYIPQGQASSEFTLGFNTSASGILPDVQRGYAGSEFTLGFTTSAVGVLGEN